MNTDFWREETPLNSTNNFYSMQHSPLKRIKQVDLYTEMAREGRYGLELVISSKTVVISSSNTPKKTPPLYGTANSERTVNVQAKRHVTSTRSFCGLMEMWPETRRRTVFTVQSKGTQRHTKVIKATDAPGLQIVTRSDLCVFFLFGFHSMGPCDTEPKNPHADSFQLADLGCVRCVSVHYTLHPVRNHHGSRVSSPHHL